MVRIGEDISERLDIVPAQFFVQRQIRGKWACKCCQLLVQEPAAPQVFDNALPTPGLQAHTLVSRFVDHIPYYRQEQINARSGVHTPRSTLAGWGGQTGAQLMPLYDAHRAFVLGSRVVHADETPISLLDPGAGKTKKPTCGPTREAPSTPSPRWCTTSAPGEEGNIRSSSSRDGRARLVADRMVAMTRALKLERRIGARLVLRTRGESHELVKANASPVAAEAIQRIAWLYRIEADARPLSAEERLQCDRGRSKPLWDEMHLWLKLERKKRPRRKRHR